MGRELTDWLEALVARVVVDGLIVETRPDGRFHVRLADGFDLESEEDSDEREERGQQKRMTW